MELRSRGEARTLLKQASEMEGEKFFEQQQVLC